MNVTKPDMARILSDLGVKLCTFTMSGIDQHRERMQPEIAGLLGYSENTLLTLLDVMVVHTNVYYVPFEQYLDQFHNLAIGEASNIVLGLQDVDNTLGWYEFRHIKRPNGSIVGMMQDVTKHRFEQLLQQQHDDHELYKVMFRNSPVGISIQHSDLPDALVNKKFCEILGYDWYPGMRIDLRQHRFPDTTEIKRTQELALKLTNKTIPFKEQVFRYISLDESIKWIHQFKYIVQDISGEKTPHAVTMALDITEKKQLEEKFINEQSLYRRLVENSPLGIFKRTLNTTIGSANRALCNFLGYEWYPNIEIDLESHIHPDDRALNTLSNDERNYRHSTEVVIRYVRTDQTVRWIHQITFGIFTDNNDEIMIIKIMKDITDQRNLQQKQLILIDELEARNAEMERFIYTVSHDLKSPLITVEGFLGYLQDDITKGNQKRIAEDIININSAVLQMYSLLEDLLTLSRIGRIENASETVKLNSLIMEATQIVAAQINTSRAIISIEESLPTVHVDRKRIVEVFQNFLDNALKYMGEQANPLIQIGATLDDQWVTCFIKDNGIGIDPQYHEKIFGLFERLETQQQGTGIGLAIVKRTIEVHGGTVWIKSKGNDSGSTFYFTLPHGVPKNEPE